MADFPLTWPPVDTHAVDPPSDHYYASALWLCGRHPSLARLVERVPRAVERDEVDGRPWFDLDYLAAALNALDAYRAVWEDYRRRTWEPSEDGPRWDAWEAAGPQLDHDGAQGIAPMSRTEVSRLRLLAVFSDNRVALRIADVGGFDDGGRRLLHDWTLAVVKA